MRHKKIYLFDHTADKLPEGCGIGWLLNNKIKDLTTQGITQNLLDFYSFKYRRIPQVQADDFVKLCNTAYDSGFKKLLLCRQGIILRNFIEKSKEYWNNQYKDCVIVGHVLDRGEEWWQIHPQCMFLDLEWWVSNGRPEFGDKQFDDIEWTAPKIARSEKTLGQRDQTYNPTDIWATGETVQVKGKWEGHNLLRLAMEQNKKVGIWDNNLRDGKEYLYGEMMDHYEKLYQVGHDLWDARWYCANTEDLETKRKSHICKTVFSTSGGISPIANAYINNLEEGGKLICYDIDPVSVSMQWQISKNWDGKNWSKFVNDYKKENPIIGGRYVCERDLPFMDEYLEQLGDDFVQWWNTTYKTFQHDFRVIDLMAKHKVTTMLEEEISDDDRKVFIDVSNAFNYEINSILYSKNIRLQLEKDYLKFFSRYPDKFIIRGFDINEVNEDPKFPYLPKLFPWQKV